MTLDKFPICLAKRNDYARWEKIARFFFRGGLLLIFLGVYFCSSRVGRDLIYITINIDDSSAGDHRKLLATAGVRATHEYVVAT